jgi:hypothetical protein
MLVVTVVNFGMLVIYGMLLFLRGCGYTYLPTKLKYHKKQVLDELRYLEDFFLNLTRNGTTASELYEQVQSCGMVLPRLYLLITVGCVYIKSRQVDPRT